MDPWDGFEVGRMELALAAVFYLGVWVQLTLFHWAAAFRRWEMWGPVLLSPLVAAAALLGVVSREGALGWIAAGGLALGVLEGMAGLFFHLQGLVAQIGGLSVRNLLAGPPPLMPVAYSLIGVVGLVGLFWDA